MSNQPTPKQLEALKAEACKILDRETLEVRHSDGLDFFETSVWSIEDIIKMAFASGQASQK